MARRDPTIALRHMLDSAREAVELARNRLIHAYESVDLDIVWRIVADDLPDLIHALETRFPRT